jgi:hypothetical protein
MAVSFKFENRGCNFISFAVEGEDMPADLIIRNLQVSVADEVSIECFLKLFVV